MLGTLQHEAPTMHGACCFEQLMSGMPPALPVDGKCVVGWGQVKWHRSPGPMLFKQVRQM